MLGQSVNSITDLAFQDCVRQYLSFIQKSMFWDCNLYINFSSCLPNPESVAVLDNKCASLCPHIFWSRWWGEEKTLRRNCTAWNSPPLQFKHSDSEVSLLLLTYRLLKWPFCGWQIGHGTYKHHTGATAGDHAG